MTLATGTKLGRYEIRSKIGEGGMGEVYLALDTELDRTVAIKILPEALASDQQRLQRFIQEAKAASALNHPHILTIYEIGTAGTSRFIATEFIDGDTLRQSISAGMKLADLLEVAIQAAGALAAAHAAGIIHRDIKPENIMVRRDGIVKVLDFGLAKLTARESTTVDTEALTRFKTDPGTVLGTVVYMSPEQARGMPVDARTDIFSLGVVLYEMVAGHLPFEGSTSSEVLASILSEKEPQPLARYSREAPAELERIVSKALRKNRDQRYQTIQDLLLDLKSLTGRRPFEGATAMDVMSAVLERPPLTFSEHSLMVPASLERIVFTALQKDRDARYSSANEVLAELNDLTKRREFDAEGDRPAEDKPGRRAVRKEATGSIAVLPFVNMSADPENEYFCDGLSEELLNALTRIEDLKVAARTSTFSFKGKNATVSGIGRALNVTSVLEGSVRKSGNRLRINVQLINTADGYNLWSEQYDREMKDIFDVQDEIALAVVDSLKVKLLGKEKAAVLKRYTENVEAYQLYLKGRYYWWKSTPEDFHRSRDFFQRAVDADPTYALGFCGLSSYYGFGSAWGMLPPVEGWPRSIAANARAMELDNTLAEVHNDLAGISMVCLRDWAATEREAKRAVELNPRFQEIHYLYSFYLLVRGRLDEAIAEARQALELDPLSLRLIHHLGNSYYLARQYGEAVAQYQQGVELDANNPALHESLGDVFEQMNMHREAVAEWQKAKELSGDKQGATFLGNAYPRDGFEEAVGAVAHQRLEQLQGNLERSEYVPAIHVARVYTRLGNIEQAFFWLEKACEERNVFPLLIYADPFYDSLRPDPRLSALLRSLNASARAQP